MRSPPGGRDADDRAPADRREHDRVVVAPRATAAGWRVGDPLGEPVRDGDGAQLPVGEKAEPRAVRRPERRVRPFGPGQGPRVVARERANPQTRIARAGGCRDERHRRAIRRDDRPAEVGADPVLGAVGRRECQFEFHRGRGGTVQPSGRGDDGEDDGGGHPWKRTPCRRCETAGGGCGRRRRGRRLGPIRGVERHAGLADVPQTRRGIAFEAACQQTAQGRRRVGRQPAPVGLGLEHGGERVADGLAPNARSPVSISKTTAPKAQMSARLSTGLPRACSGLMYAAVPRIIPASVDRAVSVGEFIASDAAGSGVRVLARPKSRILTRPSGVTLTLAGFKSRWTMPFSCAASRPRAISRARATTSSIGKPPVPPRARTLRPIRSASVSPSTSSMTSAGVPPASRVNRASRSASWTNCRPGVRRSQAGLT